MEWYEAQLEGQTGKEEYQSQDLQRTAIQTCRDILEIHRTDGAINHRDTIQEDTAAEQGRKDELGSGFGTMTFVLVEGNQTSHGYSSEFETQEEQQEVSGTHHEVHTNQRTEGKDIELTILVLHVLALQPITTLQEYQDGTQGEDALHDRSHRGRVVHATEQHHFIGYKVQYQMDSQRNTSSSTGQVTVFFGKEQVHHEGQ